MHAHTHKTDTKHTHTRHTHTRATIGRQDHKANFAHV
jgi:hypothetical protein